ncbi:MAG TPA: FecR domain-containing protein, partial [Chthoniobacteraceae bacterium]
MKKLLLSLAVCTFSGVSVTSGAALEHATVNKIVNEVNVVHPGRGTTPAKLQELIKDDLGVRTGTASRAELLFQDATLTRLGANTLFSFKSGTRDMSLPDGTMLLQVPKGLGGARIRTAGVSAAIT